jgi:hypothetical protein
MAIDCVANDELICERCGLPLPCKEARRNCRGPRPKRPTGAHMKQIIQLLRLEKAVGCKRCDEMMDKMNEWGPDGCRAHRAEIVEHLRTAYKETSYAALAKASAIGVLSGLALRLNPLDPLGSLVDEAIRRSELTSPR